MKPTVIITGASGFIGRHAALEFARHGWQVLALVHRAPLPLELAGLQTQGALRVLRGDATDPDSLRAAFAAVTPTAVVHCAGRASDVGWRSDFRRTNLGAVEVLVALCREFATGRFVFVSTTDVYGLRDFHGESEEELPLASRPCNPYPEFKIAAEQHIRSNLPPERHAIIRPGAVWGPGDPTLTPRLVAFLRTSPWIVHFGPWRGQNRWPLAHVRNVAVGLYLAAVRPEAAGRAINILDNERTTVDEWYRLLADIYLPGKRFHTVTLPLWPGRVVGGMITAISNALNLRQPFADPSYYAMRSVSSNLEFGNRAMLDLFAGAGMLPVSRAEGLHELAVAGKPERLPETPPCQP